MSIYFSKQLEKSISVLLVDDNQVILDLFDDILNSHPLYFVSKAGNAHDAEFLVKSVSPIHICLLDLGIDDINNDEFYLLKNYSSQLAFIIISGRSDMELAFKASKLGAVGIISKSEELVSPNFWKILGSTFLERILLPQLSITNNPILFECCSILKNEFPQTVSEWASKTNISDTYLRKIWIDTYSVHPKHILKMYNLYKCAFDYYNNMYMDKSGNSKFCKHSQLPKFQKLMLYYLQNKKNMDLIRDKRFVSGTKDLH